MTPKEIDRNLSFHSADVQKPTIYDWFILCQQLPIALWNKAFVYGRDLRKSYQPNFVSLLLFPYWQRMTGVSTKEIENCGVYNTFATARALIRKYDAFIDSSGSLAHSFTISDFKKGEFLDTVSYLVTMVDWLPVSRREKQELCQKVCQFRRDQLSILNSQQFLSQESLNFAQAVEIREKTAGQIGLLGAQILNTPFNIPQATKKETEDFFYHFCNAGQAIDDVADCQIDWQGNHPNIFLAALNENPQEKIQFGDWVNPRRRFFTVGQLRHITPRGLEMVEKYIVDQSLAIPNKQMQKAILCAHYFPKGILR